MNWIEINVNDLPEIEVLAGNFKRGSYGCMEKLVGFIYQRKDGVIVCESDSVILEECTHYVNISEYDPI